MIVIERVVKPEDHWLAPDIFTLCEVEKITTGVVSVVWSRPVCSAPGSRVHLKVGIGKKPPVDLVFDQSSGELVEAQLILQDEAVPEFEVLSGCLSVESGMPVIDLKAWRENDHILEHRCDARVGWHPSGVLSVKLADTSSIPSFEYDLGGLHLVADSSGLVVGYRLLGLTLDQAETIKLADAES